MFASTGVEMLVAYGRNVTGIPGQLIHLYEVLQAPGSCVDSCGHVRCEYGEWFGVLVLAARRLFSMCRTTTPTSHTVVAYDNPSVDNIVLQFFETLGKTYD